MNRIVSAGGVLLLGALSIVPGCGEAVPDDIEAYAETCTIMATAGPYDGDPHSGNKRIFACNVDTAFLQANTRPFPDGTVIVKESTKPGECDPWLIATARKENGKWRWDEYTRNFKDEEFARLLVPQSTCTDCHDDARDADWIFTAFSSRAAGAEICPD